MKQRLDQAAAEALWRDTLRLQRLFTQRRGNESIQGMP